MSSRRGALALVLHTHMPYVEGFGTWPFGEEWLWEAVACVYLPLLEVLDGAPVTVGLTPVLCDQLEAMRGEPGDRYLRFLREVRHEVHEEDAAGLARTGEPELAAEVRRAAGDYERAADEFERRDRDLVGAFRDLNGVELWTSSATHAVLPLLATRPGLRLQVATGENSHRRRYGDWGGGFWLPECAYDPGLERELADLGVRTFCVDQTDPSAWARPSTSPRWRCPAAPSPSRWTGRPCSSCGARTRATPEAAPTATTTAARCTTCVRGTTPAATTTPRPPRRRPESHAHAFVDRVAERAGDGGLVCCALDTELLGHWWYEGLDVAGGGPGAGAAGGPRPGHRVRGRWTACPPWSASSRRPPGARARTSPPGRRPASPTWPSPPARPSCARGRRVHRARPTRRPRPRGAGAAGAPVERLGVHGHP